MNIGALVSFIYFIFYNCYNKVLLRLSQILTEIDNNNNTYEEICGHLLYTLFMAKMTTGTSMSNTFLLKNYEK